METIVIAGTGPTCTREQLEYVQGKARLMVISDNYKLAPWADWMYSPDFLWWKHHAEGTRQFEGERWTIDKDAAREYGLFYVASADKEGLSPDLNVIHTGDHSGFACIGLAVAFGFRKIVVIGYDCGATGDTHNFGEHPPEVRVGRHYPDWLKHYPQLAADLKFREIEVINSTPVTAIDVFRRAPLEDVL